MWETGRKVEKQNKEAAGGKVRKEQKQGARVKHLLRPFARFKWGNGLYHVKTRTGERRLSR